MMKLAGTSSCLSHIFFAMTIYVDELKLAVVVVTRMHIHQWAHRGVCLQRCARFGHGLCYAMAREHRTGLVNLFWSCLLDSQCRPPRRLCFSIANTHTQYHVHPPCDPGPSPFGGACPPLNELMPHTAATTAAIMELTPEPMLACVSALRSVPQHCRPP